AQITEKPGVDPDDTGVETGSHAPGSADIPCPDRRCETVRRVIRQCESFLLGGERRNMTARPENLLAHDPRRLGQARPDRRLNPGSARQHLGHFGNTTTTDEPGPLIDGHAVVTQYLFTVLSADQRAYAGALVGRMSGLECLRALTQRLHEAVE